MKPWTAEKDEIATTVASKITAPARRTLGDSMMEIGMVMDFKGKRATNKTCRQTPRIIDRNTLLVVVERIISDFGLRLLLQLELEPFYFPVGCGKEPWPPQKCGYLLLVKC